MKVDANLYYRPCNLQSWDLLQLLLTVHIWPLQTVEMSTHQDAQVEGLLMRKNCSRTETDLWLLYLYRSLAIINITVSILSDCRCPYGLSLAAIKY